MKHLIIGVAGALLAFGSIRANATEESPAVVAVIDASLTGMPVSPLLYGQFIEHIGDLMYDVLWSEMLDDRKFFYPVGPRTEP